MNHLFIINPVAGGKKSRLAETEREIKLFAERVEEPCEIYTTKAPMDARVKVADAASRCGELYVYACGGDGTLNECVNGAAGLEHVAVTHYPCGTGNDFIKMFGREYVHKFRDLAALAGGTVRSLDLIECNGRFGINICSVGIDARIGTDVHKYSRIPIIGGSTGYVVSLVVNVIKGVNQRFKIRTGGSELDKDFSLICACNGRFYGGGFNPMPDAMPDDGIIDYLIVNKVSRLKLIRIVGKYAKGRFRELGDTVTHIRGDFMEIESGNEFVVNIDGETIYTNKAHMKLVPKGVNFIFPAGIPSFSSADSDILRKSNKNKD